MPPLAAPLRGGGVDGVATERRSGNFNAAEDNFTSIRIVFSELLVFIPYRDTTAEPNAELAKQAEQRHQSVAELMSELRYAIGTPEPWNSEMVTPPPVKRRIKGNRTLTFTRKSLLIILLVFAISIQKFPHT